MENKNLKDNKDTINKRNIEKVYFTNQQIQEYKKLIDDEYMKIKNLEKQIKHHKEQINKYENTLLNNCNHHKVPDRTCMYDKTTYYCDICSQDL